MAKKKTPVRGNYLGIDIGGTKILITLLNSRFQVRDEVKLKVEAHRGEKYFMKMLTESSDQLLKENRVPKTSLKVVGAGCPGMIRFPQGLVQLSPNISFLKNYPLAARLKRHFKVPVFVENDVNAGLYGEHQFGAARNCHSAVGLFLGTGVGGAVIVNDQLFRGVSGAAGEIGHTFLALPSFLEGRSSYQTVENMLGRNSIASDAAMLLLRQKARHLHTRVGYDVKKIKSKAIKKAIELGDSEMHSLMLNKAKILGITMANIANFLNPQVIVLGGGVVESVGSMMVTESKRVMREYAMKPNLTGLRVSVAALGDYAIAKGAAKLAYDYYFGGKA